jgi:hypothetical protein
MILYMIFYIFTDYIMNSYLNSNSSYRIKGAIYIINLSYI